MDQRSGLVCGSCLCTLYTIWMVIFSFSVSNSTLDSCVSGKCCNATIKQDVALQDTSWNMFFACFFCTCSGGDVVGTARFAECMCLIPSHSRAVSTVIDSNLPGIPAGFPSPTCRCHALSWTQALSSAAMFFRGMSRTYSKQVLSVLSVKDAWKKLYHLYCMSPEPWGSFY